jgi:hypothetical protein
VSARRADGQRVWRQGSFAAGGGLFFSAEPGAAAAGGAAGTGEVVGVLPAPGLLLRLPPE